MPHPRALASGVLALAALALPASASATEPNLVGRWPLDTVIVGAPSSTPVASGGLVASSTYDGYPAGTSSVPGRFGTGFLIDPSVDEAGVSIADPAPARALETYAVSVLLWVKAAGPPAGDAVLALKSAITETYPALKCHSAGWMLSAAAGEGPKFTVGTGIGVEPSHVATSTAALDAAKVWDGQWHAIAGIFNPATKTAQIALDGTVVAEATTPSAVIDWPLYQADRTELSVGHYPDPDHCPAQKFAGQVDELRLYNQALSANELAYLQAPAATSPRELPVPVPTPTPAPTPAPTPTPAPRVKSPLPTEFTGIKPAQVQQVTGADLAQTLTLIGDAMKTAITGATSSTAVVTSTVKQTQKDLLEAKQQQLKDAIAKLKDQGQIKLTTSAPNGSVAIVSTAVGVKVLTAPNTVKTTQVVLPAVAVPVTNGKIVAQLPATQTAADALSQLLGKDIVGVTVSAKAATLSQADLAKAKADKAKQEATEALIAQLEAQIQQALDRVGGAQDQFTDLLTQLNTALQQQQNTANQITTSGRHGLVTPVHGLEFGAKPSAKQLAARIKKLRKKVKDAQKARDAATHAAVVATADGFAQAGAADAPVVAFKVKGCTKKSCPFTTGG